MTDETEDSTSAKPTILKIFISDQETQVIDKIEENLKSLHEIEVRLNALSDEYPKSVSRIHSDKLKRIEATLTKINKTFSDISEAINRKKESVLNKLNAIKTQINNAKANDDQKETDIISNTQSEINQTRTFLQEKAGICDELTSSNEKRAERKVEMINIGKNVAEKYRKTQKILNDNIANINKCIV